MRRPSRLVAIVIGTVTITAAGLGITGVASADIGTARLFGSWPRIFPATSPPSIRSQSRQVVDEVR